MPDKANNPTKYTNTRKYVLQRTIFLQIFRPIMRNTLSMDEGSGSGFNGFNGLCSLSFIELDRAVLLVDTMIVYIYCEIRKFVISKNTSTVFVELG